MAQSAFPMGPSDVDPEQEPTVVSLDDADAMIEALASETRRRIVAALGEEPMPPSGVAEAVDTSLQNVVYHLDTLTDVGLVEVVETGYSARGAEMDLYAPTAAPVVICVGDERSERLVASAVDDEPTPAVSPTSSD